MRDQFIAGLDLGQTQDFTALAILKQSWVVDLGLRQRPTRHFLIGHLQRWPLGTKYPEIVNDLGALLRKPPLPLNGSLAVDQTGVGRPVVDMLRQARIPWTMRPITITSGHAVDLAGDGSLHVPKRDLVSSLQVVLQTHRLKWPRTLPNSGILAWEFKTFRAKITAAGNEKFEAWRERDHDDLVLAVALAVWLAERAGPPPSKPSALNRGAPIPSQRW